MIELELNHLRVTSNTQCNNCQRKPKTDTCRLYKSNLKDACSASKCQKLHQHRRHVLKPYIPEYRTVPTHHPCTVITKGKTSVNNDASHQRLQGTQTQPNPIYNDFCSQLKRSWTSQKSLLKDSPNEKTTQNQFKIISYHAITFVFSNTTEQPLN